MQDLSFCAFYVKIITSRAPLVVESVDLLRLSPRMSVSSNVSSNSTLTRDSEIPFSTLIGKSTLTDLSRDILVRGKNYDH